MIRPIKRLLVANRGEIAIRIFRAATELNIKTVAIFTYEDRYSLHRYKADEAYKIGPDEEPLKPYLDMDEILRVALENDIDAIHPGYGFLSENDVFAQKCKDVGVIWVGPDPESMLAVGDKIRAKEVALRVNAPIVQASETSIEDHDEALAVSHKIGFPIMVKAATGGGGRGMRVVHHASEFTKMYHEASGEAKTAFGNGAVFIEKYIDDPRHIEVQILGDHHGNLVHLFERDCSVQRRFQKVVEIAPATTLRQDTKTKLYQYATDITKAVNYKNAGTVEFLVDKDENIYFIEVNTRIQVEHTVTEVVTGIDLVKSQLLIAMGHPLSYEDIGIHSQNDVEMRGVAIQCRITSEDPSNNFKPDYGRLVAYRSASGFGIRLDAGHAYAGANISPFFDSLLVKVTSWGRNRKEASDKLIRALKEFRIRGVKSNIAFLLNLLQNEDFKQGNVTVGFIANHPELLKPRDWKDRGTRLLSYLGNVIVNGHEDVKKIDNSIVFRKPHIPAFDHKGVYTPGWKQILEDFGPAGVVEKLKFTKATQYTDTTFRDAHQSLLATRLRTKDMMEIAESFAKNHGHEIFSMEVWGGATFDVSMRFLKESPWGRLQRLRAAMPNTLLQMLLRGSNAVGYKAYPDNLIVSFIEESAKQGIDVFRIFDSLNWLEAMKTSIHTVINHTDSLAEVCMCYTSDIMKDEKYNLQYYLDFARRIEDEGAHILAIKDMAGLLKPQAATILVEALKNHIDIPIHLHTHDTSSLQAATYLNAAQAGVDIIDVAIASMSGLTSQPNFNSVAVMLNEMELGENVNVASLNKFSDYWEDVRNYYYPFESDLKAGTAEVYEHEIPGGQYSNLRPQARALGLESKFDLVKKNYRVVNDLLGGIVKVTPSSKVVGDMALFMTANNYTAEDIMTKGEKISFPDSMIEMMRGDLGQRDEGWPKDFQKIVLKEQKAYEGKPNDHIASINLETEYEAFKAKFTEMDEYFNFLAYQMYPKVFEDFYQHKQTYGDVTHLPTTAFFYGLSYNEEIMVEMSKGKSMVIQYLNTNEPDAHGNRLVIFRLNGADRSVVIKDKKAKSEIIANQKVSGPNDIGSPLQGSLSKILVKEGQEIEVNTPLFTIEAMKMESTVTSPSAGSVEKIHLKDRTLVSQDDLVMTLKIKEDL
jgi:pyruvate carboxylase